MKFIFLILSMCMMQSNYQILSVFELEKYLNKNDKTRFDFYLPTNLCFVYYLKSGEVVLIPNDRADTSKGILFSEKKYFDECVENDSFPVENVNKRMEENYQEEIKTVNTQINKIIFELNSKLSPKEVLDTNNIFSLSKLLELTKKKWKKLTTKEQVYAALLLGEYTRRIYNGKWLLIKKYGSYNPYYEPAILYPDNSILDFWNYLTSYFNRPGTPEIFVTLPYIADRKMKLSPEDDLSRYKILE